MSPLRVVIAGGGTGGHVFPGLAVADALRKTEPCEVTFVGSRRGMEARVIPSRGYALELLTVEPMVGGGVHRAARGAAIAARATVNAIALLWRIRPSVVLSVGGFAAGPVSLASLILRIPLAVLEPNAATGLTNRLVLPFAERAYFGWGGNGSASGGRNRRFGVPIRDGFKSQPFCASHEKRVLVLGGSQGAASLNRWVPDAIGAVAKRCPKIEVLHQTGATSVAEVGAAYQANGVGSARVVSFIDDVASAIAWADVVVARAGASTLAEIASIGRAMILVPFPHAAGDHQSKNAEALVRAGAALAIKNSELEARLPEELAALVTDDQRLRIMASNAAIVAQPDAAIRIADDIIDIALAAGVGGRPGIATREGSPLERLVKSQGRGDV